MKTNKNRVYEEDLDENNPILQVVKLPDIKKISRLRKLYLKYSTQDTPNPVQNENKQTTAYETSESILSLEGNESKEETRKKIEKEIKRELMRFKAYVRLTNLLDPHYLSKSRDLDWLAEKSGLSEGDTKNLLLHLAQKESECFKRYPGRDVRQIVGTETMNWWKDYITTVENKLSPETTYSIMDDIYHNNVNGFLKVRAAVYLYKQAKSESVKKEIEIFLRGLLFIPKPENRLAIETVVPFLKEIFEENILCDIVSRVLSRGQLDEYLDNVINYLWTEE